MKEEEDEEIGGGGLHAAALRPSERRPGEALLT